MQNKLVIILGILFTWSALYIGLIKGTQKKALAWLHIWCVHSETLIRHFEIFIVLVCLIGSMHESPLIKTFIHLLTEIR